MILISNIKYIYQSATHRCSSGYLFPDIVFGLSILNEVSLIGSPHRCGSPPVYEWLAACGSAARDWWTAFRQLHRLDEHEFTRMTELETRANLQGALGERYSRKIFDQIPGNVQGRRLGNQVKVIDPASRTPQERRLDSVYEFEDEIVPVEAKDIARTRNNHIGFELDREISKARGAYNEYVTKQGKTMTKYVFHFVYNNFNHTIPAMLRTAFQNDPLLITPHTEFWFGGLRDCIVPRK